MMADESTLVRIADLARTLRAACPGDVVNLRNATKTLRWCRDEPEHTTDRLTANALHAVTAYRALIDEYAGHLRDLLKLVYQHLPAEGRTLRELSRVDEPLDRWDWDAAAGELHGIEVAALSATTPTAPAGEPAIDDPLPLDVIELPELLPTDVDLLHLLEEQNGVIAYQNDLVTVAERSTAGRRLEYLIGIGYVKRPDGRKRGYLITDAGRERLRQSPESPS